MKLGQLSEFKPTILFLVKFVALYVIGNLVYGWYITTYSPVVDPATHAIAANTSWILDACVSPSITYRDHLEHPTTSIIQNHKAVLSVYEGCNGINTMIIFVVFLMAFSFGKKELLWFIPLGLVIIYAANVIRILLLFFVATRMPHVMYFTHKYLFTAFLFGVIFMLWMWWIMKFAKPKKNEV